MKIFELAKEVDSYVVELRRHFHTHPELSNKEENTIARIKQELDGMGIPYVEVPKGGLLATIEGVDAGKGKTVLLRADMDALPVPENAKNLSQDRVCCSEVPGVMHACGHDSHMAMLLGAAKILTEIREELPGTVKLLFQPAEEVALGAKAMIAEGMLDDVDAIYGAHIWGDFDAPLIDVTPGNRMACCDSFVLTVEGASTHGSTPHLGTDALVASAAIIQNLQSYVSRKNDPLNPLVVTVGKIDGGQRFNIIANKVVMEGTCRTFSHKILKTIDQDLLRIAQNTAAAYGAVASIEYTHMTLPVINDNAELNRIAHNAALKLYGEEGIGHLPTMMGSEDFSFFMEKVPGVFGFIGSRTSDSAYSYTNHHEKYTVPEDVLQRGAAMHAQFALDFLMEKAAEA